MATRIGMRDAGVAWPKPTDTARGEMQAWLIIRAIAAVSIVEPDTRQLRAALTVKVSNYLGG